MLNLAIPIWELVLRSGVVYAFLLVLLRLTGKRQIGQLAPFDLVLLLVLSNAVQNSMNGGDNSLVGGLVSAATLVALNYAVGYATFRNKRLEELIEGRPQVVIHNGRRAGCSCSAEVQLAILENNGSISVVMRSGGEDPLSRDGGPSA